MTDEQKAAFIVAQAALLNAEIAGMQAENQFRVSVGHSIAYADEEFTAVFKRYEGVLGHNAVLELFNGRH